MIRKLAKNSGKPFWACRGSFFFYPCKASFPLILGAPFISLRVSAAHLVTIRCFRICRTRARAHVSCTSRTIAFVLLYVVVVVVVVINVIGRTRSGVNISLARRSLNPNGATCTGDPSPRTYTAVRVVARTRNTNVVRRARRYARSA
uniref:Uncharacterized protein n=1 Tax=Sipha flava TaxID=143950 RepID=A0A2S2QV23_9HEMI